MQATAKKTTAKKTTAKKSNRPKLSTSNLVDNARMQAIKAAAKVQTEDAIPAVVPDNTPIEAPSQPQQEPLEAKASPEQVQASKSPEPSVTAPVEPVAEAAPISSSKQQTVAPATESNREVDLTNDASILEYVRSRPKEKRNQKQPKNFHLSSLENEALKYLAQEHAKEIDIEDLSEQKIFEKFMVTELLVQAVKRGFKI